MKRYLLTLVALLAMTTGAWADEPKVYTSAVAITDLEVGDILAEGFSLTSTDEYNTIKFAEGRYTAVGTTSTSMPMVFYKGTGKNAVITGSQSSSNFTVAPKDEKGNAGNAWEVTKAESGAITVVTLAGITYDPADVEVTTDAAQAGDPFTTASFAMPAYDATVSYELVRDLSESVNFLGIPTDNGATVKKDGDKYTFATAPIITLSDVLNPSEATTIFYYNDGFSYVESGLTLNVYPMVEMEGFPGYYKTDETATPVALTDFLASPQPGRWKIKATATTGLYDGTLYSPEFTLAEAYDLTLSPATDANLKSVTVAGTPKTADENGVIKNIEPTKKVKITTTGPDYIIRKAAVKKSGPALLSINIGGWATIYYLEGETWKQAIENHPTENNGWHIVYGTISHNNNPLKYDNDNYSDVASGDKVDPSKKYIFI